MHVCFSLALVTIFVLLKIEDMMNSSLFGLCDGFRIHRLEQESTENSILKLVFEGYMEKYEG
jgi:hypothetical protein